MNIQAEFTNNGEHIQKIMEDITNNYLIKRKTCNLSDTELECTNKKD